MLLRVAAMVLTMGSIFGVLHGADEKSIVDWVRANAIPLQTPEARRGFADLQKLKQVLGGARIVSLGEATHGSREFFQLKHRMMEFLASEMGFTIFWFWRKFGASYDAGWEAGSPERSQQLCPRAPCVCRWRPSFCSFDLLLPGSALRSPRPLQRAAHSDKAVLPYGAEFSTSVSYRCSNRIRGATGKVRSQGRNRRNRPLYCQFAQRLSICLPGFQGAAGVLSGQRGGHFKAQAVDVRGWRLA